MPDTEMSFVTGRTITGTISGRCRWAVSPGSGGRERDVVRSGSPRTRQIVEKICAFARHVGNAQRALWGLVSSQAAGVDSRECQQARGVERDDERAIVETVQPAIRAQATLARE